ncbi:MAG: protein translocase subunit SecD [Dehalococcoidia bacterium]|nr:MAG: protein translocase subunit SecD [Dehalococcoidia bacterium]
MNRGNLIRLGIIVVLLGLALGEVFVRTAPSIGESAPGNNTLGMRLGLDLSGGIHLVYEADFSEIGNETKDQALDGVIDIISRRIDAFGVSEPVIQKQGGERIAIQLPGIRDMQAAVDLVGQTAVLDYRELTPESWQLVQEFTSQGYQPDLEILTQEGEIEWIPATGYDSRNEEVQLTGKYLQRNAQVILDPTTNEPSVAFEFNSEGADLFAQITGRLVGQPLGIFLDNEYVSSPTVRSVIEGGSGVIENILYEDARDLAILLNAGALPVPLGHWQDDTFVSGPAVQDEVDPTLGADSLRKSLIAGAVGLFLVLLFMALFYRVPGLLAGGALLIYGTLILAAFKLVPVTLTLAGIAAFILSIGMAVDANVLIFERLKEELRAGRTLGGAIEAGFNRAWNAIRDSNITTLIICGILYWMGSNFAEPRVMGFALTLAIGVALSMFTAIFVTRTFLRLFVGTGLATRLWLFGAQRPEHTPEVEE